MQLQVMSFNIHKGLSAFNRQHTLPLLKECLAEQNFDLIFLRSAGQKRFSRPAI